MTKFNKPTNKWIEEEIELPVVAPVVNKRTNKIEIKETTQKVKQRTFYADTRPRKVICGNHHFVCINKGKYIFKCTKCDFHKIAYPVTYRFNQEDGTLIHRINGTKV